MCHSDDSRPPAPPTVGEVGASGQLELVAADGNRLAAHEALPAGTARAGVVVLPDVRGLHPYYVALTERFAQAGLAAVAIDYFGRTDGVALRDDSFDYAARVPHLLATEVEADAAAAVARLRVEHGVHDVFSVGFCFGGGQSWRLAASDLGLAGAIGFYGRPALVSDVVDELDAPLLLLVAGADRATPVAAFEELSADLDRAGKAHEMHVYDGAPHSFFDRSFADWREACDDAWRRMLDFMERHAESEAPAG